LLFLRKSSRKLCSIGYTPIAYFAGKELVIDFRRKSPMSLCGTDQDKERIIKRLRRIEGQVRGLSTMVEQDKDCIEVLRQINSATGALRGVWTQVIGDHLRGCIAKSMIDHDEKLIEELMDHLQKIR
jgi:DNA-binding FrmR family transcriptional regulator